MNATAHPSSKRAVLYCRVSTKEQADEGNSLVSQERSGKEWAAKNGYDIVKVFVERGESAKTVNRPELNDMLKFCADSKRNGVQAVIVYKIDRLSRNTDDYSQLRLLLKRYTVEIKSTTEFFENTPAGRFMENIIANVAQFDNDVRSERCANGMRDAVREGRYVWAAPVGYANVKITDKATIAPSEMAGLVREAFELVATGLHSTDEVWRMTREKGLHKKNGKPLTKGYFHNMLRNELYTGWVEKFNERHKGLFTPVVSEELFAQVQRVLKNKGHKVTQYKSDNPAFPLRRFVSNTDGTKLTGSFSRGRSNLYPFYRFGSRGKNYSRDEFETQFMAKMDSYRFKESQVEKLKRHVRAEFNDSIASERKTAIKLRERLVQLDDEETSLMKKSYRGVVTDAALKRELERIESVRVETHAALATLENLAVSPDEAVAFAEQYLLAPSSVWKDSDLATQMKLQWFQFPSGLVFDGVDFGTAEVSSVFKAKDALTASLSSNVDRAYKTLNSLKEYLAEFWGYYQYSSKLREVLEKISPEPPTQLSSNDTGNK